jgi:hypothetical protein
MATIAFAAPILPGKTQADRLAEGFPPPDQVLDFGG